MRVFLGLSFFLLTACSSITMHIPGNRFQSPEALGEAGKARLDIGSSEASHQIELTDNFLYFAPSPARTSIKTNYTRYRTSVGVGIFSFLDLEFHARLRGIPTLQAKVQLLGAPQMEAKKGNTSLALTAGYGTAETAQNGQVEVLLPTTIRSEISWVSVDASLILGHRVSDGTLFYGGPYYNYLDYSGHYSRNIQGTLISDSVRFSGVGYHYGVHLGYQFEIFTRHLTGKLEVAYSILQIAGATHGGLFPGGQLSVVF